jgi:fibro-slime domain-containing protein
MDLRNGPTDSKLILIESNKMKSVTLVSAICASALMMGSVSTAASITLSGVVRDFLPDGQEFEGPIDGLRTGIVLPTLGVDNKPVYNPLETAPSVVSAATFNRWYNTIPGVNIAIPLAITLTETAPGIYSYSNNAFFPIDGQGFGNYASWGRNYHFTFELLTRFTYQSGQNFTFSGDDDLWVFINKNLVIDLGGVHGAIRRSVNLDGLGLILGQDYDLALFFAERHTTSSTFNIQTSIVLQQELNPVPEPATIFIFCIGIAESAAIRSRGKKKDSING